MLELVYTLPQQIEDALSIIQSSDRLSAQCTKILICGLGGSGIGGSILKDTLLHTSKVPILLNKGYTLPSYVDTDTLVIVSSYSGNTEETLTCMEAAHALGCTIACITSGGKVEAFAKAHRYYHIIVPGGQSPRAMLAYSLVALYAIVDDLNICSQKCIPQLQRVPVFLKEHSEIIGKQAKSTAELFYKNIAILYGMEGFSGVTERMKQQINENSKMLCWQHIIPEMNHNELVGWTQERKDIAVLFMTNASDNSRNIQRQKINADVIGKYAATLQLSSAGSNLIEESFYWIHFGDIVSALLAIKNNVDPFEVRVIDYLKSELAKMA